MYMCEVCEHDMVTHRGLKQASELELPVLSCEMFYIGADFLFLFSKRNFLL